MAKPGIKSMRGRPEAYDEPKIPTCLSLTETARTWLKQTAKNMNTSCSDLLEKAARGDIEPLLASLQVPIDSSNDK